MKRKSFKFKRTPISVAILLAFSTPLPAWAQDATEEETRLPEVKVSSEKTNDDYAPGVSTVGSKTETPIRDIPQTVNVINRAVIDAQAATTLTEALRNVPGITITAGEGGQIGDNINLRGFSARTDVYLDGFRDRGQYKRDIFALEAVEVLKGPSSMLFGRGSTGGVVNQVSKRPRLVDEGSVSGSIGTDNYYRSTLDVNRKLSDSSAFRVAVMAQDTESTRDVVENKDVGVAPSVRFGMGTDTEVTLSALAQRSRDIPDYGFPVVKFQGETVARPIDAPANRFYGFTDDKFNQDVYGFNAAIRHKLAEDVTLRNQSQFLTYRIAAAPTPLGTAFVDPTTGATIAPVPPRGTPLSSLNVIRQTRDRVIDDQSLFNQTDIITKAMTGSIQHTIITGLEIGRDDYHNDQFIWTSTTAAPNSAPGNVQATPAANLGNPGYARRPPQSATILRLPQTVTDTTANTLAVYANDQLDLSKQWKLVGGLRWDRFTSDQSAISYAYTYPIVPATPNPTLSRVHLDSEDSMLSTRAGVIYQPTDLSSYYVSYGTSFNPSAEAVTLSANNSNLDPEKSRSYEAGAKWDLMDGGLALTTAIFRIEKTNARTTDPLTSVVSLDGDIRVDGFEISAAGRITPKWQIIGGYTFLDGKIVDSKDVSSGIPAKGKTPQNTPKNSATLWATYRIIDSIEAGGGLIYSSDRFVNNFESAEIDGYTRFDATVAYIQKSYDIRLNLQNLTDEKYFETASGGRATPVTGRRAIITATTRF